MASNQRFMRRESAETPQIGLYVPLSSYEFIIVSPFFTSKRSLQRDSTLIKYDLEIYP
jgi:hypothetical protein